MLKSPSYVAAGTQGPDLILDAVLTGYGDADWTSPPATLEGLTVAISDTGSPTTWGPDSGNGLTLAGGTTPVGIINLDLSDLSDIMDRSPIDTDGFVFEVQFADSFNGITATNSVGQINVDVAAANDNGITGFLKSGANNRRVGHYNGSAFAYALQDNGASARSTSLWLQPGGEAALAFWSDSALSEDGPLRSGTQYMVTGNTSRATSGAGPWAVTGGGDVNLPYLARGSGESADTIVERIRIWLLPGADHE